MNDIITYNDGKNQNINNFNTLLTLWIHGDGSEVMEYKLDPDEYIRTIEQRYKISFVLNGVFWTRNSIDFMNDILARFTLSMNIIESQVETIKKIKNKGRELNYFQNLESVSKKVFIPNHIPKDDFVFYSLKIWVESRLREKIGLIPYETLFNYSQTHFLDYTKDYSTLKAKCRSIWNWYNDRDWKPTIRESKFKTKKEFLMNRSENITRINIKRKEDNKIKIISLITGNFKDDYKKNNGKWNITKISKQVKISRPTIYKILLDF